MDYQPYFLKGYILKLSSPPIRTNTQVQWKITDDRNGPIGQYSNDNSWTEYSSGPTNPSAARCTTTPPTTRTIYWRSNIDGEIGQSYDLQCAYMPIDAGMNDKPSTITRTLMSREIKYDMGRTKEPNADVDMLQRLMTQLFFLNKGQLSDYVIGQYLTIDDVTYTASKKVNGRARMVPNWSPKADEVKNFQQFAMNIHPPDGNLDIDTIRAMWGQLNLILRAPNGAIDNTDLRYAGWASAAVTAAQLSVPNGLNINLNSNQNGMAQVTAQQVFDQLVVQEGGTHSIAITHPLAVCSVQVGEAVAGRHTYTDDGLGFCKVQPYNSVIANVENLFLPDQNLIAGARILEQCMDKSPHQRDDIVDNNRKPYQVVWDALYKYNSGKYPAVEETELTDRGAVFANNIFFQLYMRLPGPKPYDDSLDSDILNNDTYLPLGR